MPRNRSYLHDVDRLVEETPLDLVLRHYGLDGPDKSSGEYRMTCPFNVDCRDSPYGNLTVNLDSSAKLIYAHCCQIHGNLLTLIHGLETHSPPSTDKLRGDEFNAAVHKLREINGLVDSTRPNTPQQQTAPAESNTDSELTPPPHNEPLRLNENARSLVNLWEDCIVDPADIPPAAAAYFRKRPWLTPEVCRKWKMGYLPKNGRSLLRGMIIYAHEDEAGEIFSYSGRDVNFESKWQKWISDGKPEKQKPNKHRYVKGYHRGLELYGQQADRLKDRRLKEFLGKHGLVVVEGQNDVIRLDQLGVPAVGLCSNRVTDEQIEKIARIARSASRGRVILLPDNDAEGEAGAKELLWQLAQQGLTVTMPWSRISHEGQFTGRQPEDLTVDEWMGMILAGIAK